MNMFPELLKYCLILFAFSVPSFVYGQTCDDTRFPTLATAKSEAWGIDRRNSRHQPTSSINADNIDQVKIYRGDCLYEDLALTNLCIRAQNIGVEEHALSM